MVVLDRRGNEFSSKRLERKLDRAYMKKYEAAYISFPVEDTMWVLPGSIKMIITDVKRDIDIESYKKVELQDGVDRLKKILKEKEKKDLTK